MKRNAFLTAALEELQKEVATGDQPATAVVPATTTAPQGGDTVAATSSESAPVTEVNIDQSVDAIASLMEKNKDLQDKNASLEEENFDSDLDILDSASDSAQSDLAECVSACEALQELAHIANLTVKSGQANAANVASLAFGLEQICLRAGLESPVAALEDSAISLYHPATGSNKEATSEEAATAQADAIGKTAMEKAKAIGQKLMDGIKRIVGWILNILRQFFTRLDGLSARIKKCAAEYDQIDESKTIDSKPFIASLRLVEGAGDPSKQFETYAAMATKTLFGFFSDTFVGRMMEAFEAIKKEESDEERIAGMKELGEVVRIALSTIYTVDGNVNDVPGFPSDANAKDWTVGLTTPCVGGVQLYLAASLEGEGDLRCKSGLAATQPKIEMPDSIPVVDKQFADKMFSVITKWLHANKQLEQKLALLHGLKFISSFSGKQNQTKAVSQYLSVLAAMATGAMPHLLRMNMQNSVNFISYVEKSIAVSKAAIHEKK